MFSIASKISFSRRSLFFGVIVIISITTSIILFANVEAREHYSDWIISITASVTGPVPTYPVTVEGDDVLVQMEP